MPELYLIFECRSNFYQGPADDAVRPALSMAPPLLAIRRIGDGAGDSGEPTKKTCKRKNFGVVFDYTNGVHEFIIHLHRIIKAAQPGEKPGAT
jgi:hypothetical protein